jgi:hypothetical protein
MFFNLPILPAPGPAPVQTPHIIRHQYGASRNCMSGNGRVVRADRRAGHAQRHLNLSGRIHRGAIPGQDGIEAGAERVNQRNVAREAFGPVAPERISA